MDAITAAAEVAGRSFQSFSQATGAALEVLERRYPHSLLLVSQFDYAESEYRVLDARGHTSDGLAPGTTLPLEASLCFPMATDRAPRLCPDVAGDPVYRTLDLPLDHAIRSYMGVPLELSDGNRVGSLAAFSRELDAFRPADLDLLAVVGKILAAEFDRVRRERELRRLRGLVRQQDVADPLTGLADRQRFTASLDREWRLTQRTGMSSYLTVMRLAGLPHITERYGAAMVELLVKDVARALTAVSRGTDVTGRVGVDAFGVVLVDCKGEEGAAAFCGRMRTALERVTSERPMAVEVAFGVTSLSQGASPGEALALAERSVQDTVVPVS
jgi:diguanylate cyclase (GGDEF)-like protein